MRPQIAGVTPDLIDDEKAILVELLRETIERSKDVTAEFAATGPSIRFMPPACR
jgi:hypothetical protein